MLHLKYMVEKKSNTPVKPTEPMQETSAPAQPSTKPIEKTKPTEKVDRDRPRQAEKTTPGTTNNKPKPRPVTKETKSSDASKRKTISKSIQIYKGLTGTSQLNPLTSVVESYRIEGPPPRKVSVLLLRHSTETFTTRKAVNAQCALLNLPRVAAESPQEMEYKTDHPSIPSEKKAQTMFMKGRYADAHALVVEGDNKAVDPECSQVEALFPPGDDKARMEEILGGLQKSKTKAKIHEKQVTEAMSTMKGARDVDHQECPPNS